MKESFWVNKWLNNEIGFHQLEYNSTLIKYWGEFTGGQKEDVLVPLCGKTLDMVYLSEQGHKVYGVELSRLAVETFFSEQVLKPIKENERYFTDKFSIYCKDILRIPPDTFKKIYYIYDRASIVALPPELREKYVEWIKQVGTYTKIFLIAFDFNNDEVGPPFSVPEAKIREYFEDTFNVQKRKEVEVTGDDVQIHGGAVTSFKIQTYFLTKR